MFDLLRKKISSFVSSLAGKEEGKKPEAAEAPKPAPAGALVQEKPLPVVEHAPIEPEQAVVAEVSEPVVAEPAIASNPVEQHVEKPRHAEPGAVVRKPVEQPPARPVESIPVPKQVELPVVVPKFFEPAEPPKERPFLPKLGIISTVRSVFSGEVQLAEAEVKPVLEDLELALLESDVTPATADYLVGDLKARLVGKRVARSAVREAIRGEVRNSFLSVFSAEPFSLFNYVSACKEKGKPAVVLFVGPNGAGKTTTIAKLAKQLQDRGFTSVIAASDTFRKAAIEQAQVHGDKLGIKVVKHGYGADPTAVAFDAVAHARAGGADVVLVDTAGRQETNLNLVREMEKMARVLKPDLKLFVGEAIAGHALVEQVSSFKQAIGLDGVILTKLDCDAKGGGAFSIARETGLPILFVGVGQGYSDLVVFDSEWLVSNVLAE